MANELRYDNIILYEKRGSFASDRLANYLEEHDIDFTMCSIQREDQDTIDNALASSRNYHANTALNFPFVEYDIFYYENETDNLEIKRLGFANDVSSLPTNFANVAVKLGG